MLQIPLSPDAEELLRERAKASGEDVSSYAARLLQDALVAPSVDELLAAFRSQVEDSGITDTELNSLGEDLRTDAWQEQQARKAKKRVTTLAVYDCMLFFRAAARPRLARPLFDLVHKGDVTLCLGPEVLAEIRDVLTRPKLLAKYPALTAQAVDAFLAQHLRMATWITDVPEHYVLARDPKDSKYLNLAISANASYVVTDDLDLLDLMEPQSSAGQEFRVRYSHLRIVSSVAFEVIVARPLS